MWRFIFITYALLCGNRASSLRDTVRRTDDSDKSLLQRIIQQMELSGLPVKSSSTSHTVIRGDPLDQHKRMKPVRHDSDYFFDTPLNYNKRMAPIRDDISYVIDTLLDQNKRMAPIRDDVIHVVDTPLEQNKRMEPIRDDISHVVETPLDQNKRMALIRDDVIHFVDTPLDQNKRIGPIRDDIIHVVDTPLDQNKRMEPIRDDTNAFHDTPLDQNMQKTPNQKRRIGDDDPRDGFPISLHNNPLNKNKRVALALLLLDNGHIGQDYVRYEDEEYFLNLARHVSPEHDHTRDDFEEYSLDNYARRDLE